MSGLFNDLPTDAEAIEDTGRTTLVDIATEAESESESKIELEEEDELSEDIVEASDNHSKFSDSKSKSSESSSSSAASTSRIAFGLLSMGVVAGVITALF
ncbi:hypothetical protein LPJ66_007543 [Kickxella alabastrina]|uniref:Uncharacterized protein n=1 Tax=Kickxella alabastrina TaxID=61397 RepID=A0ACC1I991_9FUNG|nr:hypothetical protein LPJ66_007543 [Kickxella alabastrina]